jgi:ATP-dependent Clp protease ATP-binding subunit ClpC
MAFEKFTNRACKVVDLATTEAAQLGDTSVDTVDLLVGMLREGSGVAGSVLAGFEVDVDSVLEANKSIDNEPDAALPEVESRCMAEAKWLGHNYVGTEHLLLGVCSLTDCKAVRLLSGIGKPPVELCQEVLELLGHGNEWNRWIAEHS